MHQSAKIDRRHLLAAAGTLLVGRPKPSWAEHASQGSQCRLFDDFASQLGREFLLEDENGHATSAVLVEVSPSKFAPGAGFRKPFSVVFRLAASAGSEQAVYRLRHRSLGSMRLLLAPITPPGSDRLFESVFG